MLDALQASLGSSGAITSCKLPTDKTIRLADRLPTPITGPIRTACASPQNAVNRLQRGAPRQMHIQCQCTLDISRPSKP